MRSLMAVYLLHTYLLLSTVMKKSLVKFYITVEELLDMGGNIGLDSFLSRLILQKSLPVIQSVSLTPAS